MSGADARGVRSNPMVGRIIVLLLLVGLVYLNFARLRRASRFFDDGEPDGPKERR